MKEQSLLLTACNDDILRLVLDHIDTVRDLFALSLSCKSLYHFIRSEGWRSFVRKRFPWFSIPASHCDDWFKFAQSLRFQTRCWERRSFKFRTFIQDPGTSLGRYGRRRGVPFQAVVDVHFDHDAETELLVWGAGEDIVGRWRQKGALRGSPLSTWHESLGSEAGYAPGPDDVRAIRIISQPLGQSEDMGILEGRDNGHLRLLSAEQDKFGTVLAKFHPAHSPDREEEEDAVEQGTINSLDVLQPHGVGQNPRVVAATKDALLFYKLPGAEDSRHVLPYAVQDLRQTLFKNQVKRASLCSAKWMGEHTVVFTLKGAENPLRYLQLRESGVTYHTAVKNLVLQAEHSLRYRNICPNSLQLVPNLPSGRTNESLLLSSWKDGTIRLQDLRTPSLYDTLYQDNINPAETMETLLVKDTERFIGASGSDLSMKVFDFRWSRPYNQSNELSCSGHKPFPIPRQPYMTAPRGVVLDYALCEPLRARQCAWHALAHRRYYRPNAKLFLLDASGPQAASFSTSTRRIWSLARSSPIAPNFFLGISGGIIEASIEPSLEPPNLPPSEPRLDANYAFADWDVTDQGASCSYVSHDLLPALQEIGDGLASPLNQRSIKLPPLMMSRDWSMHWDTQSDDLRMRHRLDRSFQRRNDFSHLQGRIDAEEKAVEDEQEERRGRWDDLPRRERRRSVR